MCAAAQEAFRHAQADVKKASGLKRLREVSLGPEPFLHPPSLLFGLS